jgi:hypothetical protein
VTMRTNISISPHTYSSREATSQPQKERTGEVRMMCILLSQSGDWDWEGWGWCAYYCHRVGTETDKGVERMCKKKNSKRTECLTIMTIINIIMIIILLLLFECCAFSVIGHWPADSTLINILIEILLLCPLSLSLLLQCCCYYYFTFCVCYNFYPSYLSPVTVQ